jgi:GDP-mannose 6-dehydrogenase
MRVSVFGLGYVGSVTAACLAKAGHEVVAVDISEQKVALASRGASPVVEPGLEELLAQMVGRGRLGATVSSEEAVAKTDAALICVGTPSRSDGSLDVSAVEHVAHGIGRALRHRSSAFTVILRSTVLPGTTETILVPALSDGAGHPLDGAIRVAVNPEFMREGSSLRDFAEPPFVLVGCQDPGTAAQVRSLYSDVAAPFISTSIRTAEMVKYASNAFHALKICFANEIGDACEALGADPFEVIRVFLTDHKLNISEAYLQPGFAFGGSCLPKDLRAILSAGKVADLSLPLLSAILPSNDTQLRRAIKAVIATGRKRVGVVGLAFKPGTDDLRESPMVPLVQACLERGLDVRVFDPNIAMARLVGANRRDIEANIPQIASLMCERLEPVLDHAEVLVIGSVSDDAVRTLAAVRPEQVVIDLTRGAAARRLARVRGPAEMSGSRAAV